MDRSVIVKEADRAYTVTTGKQQTCFKGCEAAADQIACLHTIVRELEQQVAALTEQLEQLAAHRDAFAARITELRQCVHDVQLKLLDAVAERDRLREELKAIERVVVTTIGAALRREGK